MKVNLQMKVNLPFHESQLAQTQSTLEPYGWQVYGPKADMWSVGVWEREFFIDNLLVPIRLIIEMIIVDRPYAMGI